MLAATQIRLIERRSQAGVTENVTLNWGICSKVTVARRLAFLALGTFELELAGRAVWIVLHATTGRAGAHTLFQALAPRRVHDRVAAARS
jgi:hypothetical protein